MFAGPTDAQEPRQLPRHLARLNPAQRAAAAHDGPALLVVAGAGTGKTGTLAARVAHLIESGVPPQRVLLLTFTRKAAQEMLSRAAQLTDAAAAAQVWGGTFHSVAHRLLRSEGRAVGLPEGFTLLDPADAVELFGIVRAEHVDTSGPRLARKETIAAIYDRVVGTQQPLESVLKTDFPWCIEHLETLPAMFSAYTQRKRARQLLDFADLLLFWRAMMATPGVGEAIAARFTHVLVDEFQDTDPVQADIVHALADRGVQLTVVGDDAQAIYGFRAATVANMWDFANRRADAHRVTLEENYRSLRPILELANDVLAASGSHFDKELRPARSGTRMPRLVTCRDETSQAVSVADRILELREEGYPLADQAVLFRAGHHSDLLELELGRRDIPFVKFGGLKFLEAAHVKDLVCLLRILDNPYDELAWTRTLRALPGVGPASAAGVLRTLGVTGGEPTQAAPATTAADPLHAFLHGPVRLPRPAQDEAAALADALRDCVTPAADGTQPAPALQVERLARWLASTLDRRYDRAERRAEDLGQLARTAEAYTSRARFLAELVLEPPASSSDLAGAPHLDDDTLTLSTIHSAKGGEWGAVHIIHAADGNLPADMSLSSAEGLEEERRLLYVALTRARDVLDVYVPLRYHHTRSRSDRHSYVPVSRFLAPLRHRFVEATDSGATQGDDPGALDPRARVTIADEVDASIHRLWS